MMLPAEWIAAAPRSFKSGVYHYLLLPMMAGYAVSILTGFSFGVSNNVFHIPYVLNFCSRQEFLHDPYYGSLDKFTSVVWPLVRLVATEANIGQLFYVAYLVSRIAAFAGLVYLIRLAGFRKPEELLLATVALVLAPLLQNSSVIGDHGMFEPYFTHSEVTWAFVFLSVGLLYADRVVLSYAMTGIAFSINAFIGIWLLVINTLVLVSVRRSMPLPVFLKAMAVFALFALPVTLWILSTMAGPRGPVGFSYLEYVRLYYPQHFLVETPGARIGMLKHLALVASGLLAARYLPNARFWVVIQLGALMIVMVGIPLPYLFDNRFVFNLHLIRAAGLGQAFATVFVALAGVRLLLDGKELERQLTGLVALLSLTMLERNAVGISMMLISMSAAQPGAALSGYFGRGGIFRQECRAFFRPAYSCLVLFMAALLHQFYRHGFTVMDGMTLLTIFALFGVVWMRRYRQAGTSMHAVIILMLFMAGLGISRSRLFRDNQMAKSRLPENRSWQEMMESIRSGNLRGPFLISLDDQEHSDYFQLQARRLVWVDWKQGAAVMWSPSFYRQWSTRYREVSALHSSRELITYAKAKGIRYVLLHTPSESVPVASRLIKRTNYHLLYEVL